MSPHRDRRAVSRRHGVHIERVRRAGATHGAVVLLASAGEDQVVRLRDAGLGPIKSLGGDRHLDLECRVQGLRSRVQSSGLRSHGLEHRVQGLGFRVSSLRFRV